jgi:hypothetical protein
MPVSISASLRLRHVSLFAFACLAPIVACSGAIAVVPDDPASGPSDASLVLDGALRDATRGKSESDTDALVPIEDASTPSNDSAADVVTDGPSTDSGDAAVALSVSGDVPVPVAIRRLTYTGSAFGPGGVIGPCPAGQVSVSPMANVYSCCFRDEAASLVKPLRVSDRIVGGVETVCLEAGSAGVSVCAPVDAQGLATFVESVELARVYSYWGVTYNPSFSDTALSIRLSSTRDLATMKISVYGRLFGSGCGLGQGTYLPTTTLAIAMR